MTTDSTDSDFVKSELKRLQDEIYEQLLVLSSKPPPGERMMHVAMITALYLRVRDFRSLMPPYRKYPQREVCIQASIQGISAPEEILETTAGLVMDVIGPHLVDFNPRFIPSTLRISLGHDGDYLIRIGVCILEDSSHAADFHVTTDDPAPAVDAAGS